MDLIKTENGYISGKVRGEPGSEIHSYRGIPYAAPPVGDLRWKPPQPAASWSGTRECTRYSIQPAQYPDVNTPEEAQRIPSSEDCLYLNVTTPAQSADEKLPVMVWLHGGGFRYGSGNWSMYNSPVLSRHGVVLVTVNSRLGVLGLLAHPLLSKESPNGVSGNYMFLDMIAALKWVQKNIAAFGGDPNNVTIFGESGGGAKVVSLMASPLAKGLFHKAICESGGGGGSQAIPLKDMEKFGEKLFAKLGIDKEKDPLSAVRALSWEKIIEDDQALNVEMGEQYVFMGPWSINVDGWFMPDAPANIFKAGKQNAVPLITLANLGELTGPGYVVAPQLIPGYVNLLSGENKAKVKGYAGIFDQVPGNWRQEGGVAAHAMEMHFVFGAVDREDTWYGLHFLYASAGAKSKVPVITDAERRVSEAMMKMWTQFARTGNPGVEGLVDWPPYEETTDRYLYIAEPLQVKAGFSRIAQKK
jgi:para-nitrobenzyl esterase